MDAAPAVLPQTPEADRRQAIRLEYFTIAWNLIEAVVAVAAGLLAGSIALVGFGLDSVIETISGVALLWRLKQRGGSEARAEGRALRVVGLTFFALAAYVSSESLRDLWFRHQPAESLVGMVLAVVSLVVMPLLGRAKRRLARRLRSRALAADGMETWADPVAALAMVPFMVREGLEAFQGQDD
jgi:divalent metal cation (Fe/Co/Zn/Cd) transporter